MGETLRRLSDSGGVETPTDISLKPRSVERYVEPQYRERAMRLRLDAHGLEYLEINASRRGSRGGMVGMLGGGKAITDILPSAHTYSGGASFGADAAASSAWRKRTSSALLYPTLGILWEAELEDVELSQAYCRAYNRWVADFCRDSKGRLIPIAHLSLGDPAAAAAELERAVKDGCRGAFVVPFVWTHKAHGDPVHDPVYAKAVELDVPIAIHPAFEPFELRSPRFENGHRLSLLASVTAGEGVRQAFTTFFDFATFDRFPKLKLVLLESGAGWIGYWLDRLDGVVDRHLPGRPRAAEAQAQRLFPPPGLDLGRSRRAHAARHDEDLRRRPLLLGVGLSASRPHRRLPAGAGPHTAETFVNPDWPTRSYDKLTYRRRRGPAHHLRRPRAPADGPRAGDPCERPGRGGVTNCPACVSCRARDATHAPMGGHRG